MTYFQRIALAVVCILLGFLFLPLFLVGGLIVWSVYRDIIEEPARRAEQAEIDARINAPVSVENIRGQCESPAETAFLEAMVSAYKLQIGPGAIQGRGLRLRNQVSVGRLNIYSGHASSQYRADFLIDDKLVVEIDGATYHSSPEAVLRDLKRDDDMRREGYSILRIPAREVFLDSAAAVKKVEDARVLLRRTGDLGSI